MNKLIHKNNFWPIVSYVFLVAVLLFALNVARNDTTNLLLENQLSSCERGNVIREVLFATIVQAAESNPTEAYAEQVRIMQSTLHTNQETGVVDCRKTIKGFDSSE